MFRSASGGAIPAPVPDLSRVIKQDRLQSPQAPWSSPAALNVQGIPTFTFPVQDELPVRVVPVPCSPIRNADTTGGSDRLSPIVLKAETTSWQQSDIDTSSRRHLELMELVTLSINTHGTNYAAMLRSLEDLPNLGVDVAKLLEVAGYMHNVVLSVDDSQRTMHNVMLGSSNGQQEVRDRLEQAMTCLVTMEKQYMENHSILYGSMKTVDQRLQWLEKNGQETNELLQKILRSATDGLDRHIKVAQEDIKRVCASETAGLRNEMMEAFERLRRQTPDISCVKGWLDNQSKGLHDKLDGHGKKHDNLTQLMQGMPSHDKLMQSVHGLLEVHMNNHSGALLSSINKMPLPPDEKVLLQAIENMQEASLGQTLEAIEKLRRQTPDISCVKGWLDNQASELHDKLDGQGKRHDNLTKLMEGMPDHDTLMQGVHGLLDAHMNNHSGNLMSSISKLPLPPDEKVLLQAIETMQQASLGQTLEAIEKLTKHIDHDLLMERFDGLLSDHPRLGHNKVVEGLDKFFTNVVITNKGKKTNGSSPSTTSSASKQAPSNIMSGSPRNQTEFPTYSAKSRSLSQTAPGRLLSQSTSSPSLRAWSSGRNDDAFSCRCGYTCGTESALTRHLARNIGGDHWQVMRT